MEIYIGAVSCMYEIQQDQTSTGEAEAVVVSSLLPRA